MCQLLGMNCNVPTDICFSFTGFHRRGGATDRHEDGWGIAFYEGRGCRLFLDTESAAASPVAALVRSYPIRSLNVIAHIRKATVGTVTLENTHPFVREMWGRYWTFAHNGTLRRLPPRRRTRFQRYRPVGTTDSERAFCAILERLRRVFPDGDPELPALRAAIAEITGELREHGDFNFLLSNGEALFAHCSTRLAYLVRKAPFAEAHLVDEDYSVDFSLLTTPEDRVAVIATVPLTDNERWTQIEPGSLIAFRDGEPALGME
jgi:glutamine amidotransferase